MEKLKFSESQLKNSHYLMEYYKNTSDNNLPIERDLIEAVAKNVIDFGYLFIKTSSIKLELIDKYIGRKIEPRYFAEFSNNLIKDFSTGKEAIDFINDYISKHKEISYAKFYYGAYELKDKKYNLIENHIVLLWDWFKLADNKINIRYNSYGAYWKYIKGTDPLYDVDHGYSKYARGLDKKLIAKESDRLKELRKILNLGENIYGFEKVRKAKDEKLDEHILDLWAEKYLNSGEVDFGDLNRIIDEYYIFNSPCDHYSNKRKVYEYLRYKYNINIDYDILNIESIDINKYMTFNA